MKITLMDKAQIQIKTRKKSKIFETTNDDVFLNIDGAFDSMAWQSE